MRRPLWCHLRGASLISAQINDCRRSLMTLYALLLSLSLVVLAFPGELIFNYLNVEMNK